jgi:leucyl-tRNA synthetase
VVNGECWRCGTIVTMRELEQWFFRITHYADELLEAAEKDLSAWPEKVLTMQRNWIGKSEGARVRFGLADAAAVGGGQWAVGTAPGAPPKAHSPEPRAQSSIEVFTTRIDTIYGATFIILAPEHPLTQQWAKEDPARFDEGLRRFQGQDRTARMTGDVEKEGFDTGRQAINPYTEKPVPVWVANFVLGEYGTGAVMGVPAHDQRDFEFARKYNLPVTAVVRPQDGPVPEGASINEAV